MKKIILALIVTILALYSCEDINFLHEKYLKEGEIVYIGKADSIKVMPGKERVLFKWLMNADPKIKTCKIYWSNRSDSSIVNINRTEAGPIKMEEHLSLPEGEYLFEFVTEDDKGNISLSSYKSGQVYGEMYISGLRSRPINNISATSEELIIEWGNIDNSLGSVLNYLDSSGKKSSIEIDPGENKTIIEDYMLGGEFDYQSMYIPDTAAIDVFYSNPAIGKFPEFIKIDKNDWEIIEVSSEESGGEGPVNGYATALIDGDTNTFWHSKWSGASLPLPHTIVIDMKSNVTASSLNIWRRSNNKDLKTVEFELSKDNSSWDKLGSVTYTTDPAQRERILELESLKVGRYLKLIVTESHSSPHASISEIFVYGR